MLYQDFNSSIHGGLNLPGFIMDVAVNSDINQTTVPQHAISADSEEIAELRSKGIWVFDVSGNQEQGPIGPQNLIAFDMDNTLSNTAHRDHFMKGKKNWDAWNAGIPNDDVNEPVAFYFRLFVNRPDTTVIIVSARDGRFRQVTEEWLEKCDLTGYAKLYMREAGSFRKDSIEKQLLLEQIVADYGRKPDFVFDDRVQVIEETWRTNGIYVFDCNQTGEVY